MRLLFAAGFLLLIACQDEGPECLSDQIERFQKEQEDCTGAFIAKYSFEGLILYGFNDGQCIADGALGLWDESCNFYCTIGGIAALDECDGVNFFQNAERLDLIWEAK